MGTTRGPPWSRPRRNGRCCRYSSQFRVSCIIVLRNLFLHVPFALLAGRLFGKLTGCELSSPPRRVWKLPQNVTRVEIGNLLDTSLAGPYLSQTPTCRAFVCVVPLGPPCGRACGSHCMFACSFIAVFVVSSGVCCWRMGARRPRSPEAGWTPACGVSASTRPFKSSGSI